MKPKLSLQELRLTRIRALTGVSASDEFLHRHRWLEHPTLLVAVVTSRVGHDAGVHRLIAVHTAQSMLQWSRSDARVLVAEGSAIEPWAMHAAELFGLDTIRLRGEDLQGADRDAFVIAAADHVDAVHVRHHGQIERLVLRRLKQNRGLSVRIGIDANANATDRNAIWNLLDAGAVGRYLAIPEREDATTCEPKHSANGVCVGLPDGEFLVHCTRSRGGPWPGQSWKSYRDDLMLGTGEVAARDAIDSLCRILSMNRLIAGAVTSKNDEPVVCFSSVPLQDLLSRRAYRPHLHRWDYEPYGIAIRKEAAVALGLQSVIYADASQRDAIRQEDRFRFQNRGKTFDWTAESEWRCRGDLDLSRLDKLDVCIFVPDGAAAARIHPVNLIGYRVVVEG